MCLGFAITSEDLSLLSQSERRLADEARIIATAQKARKSVIFS
jgi:hypothetical protein